MPQAPAKRSVLSLGDMSPQSIAPSVEAILLSVDHPVTAAAIAAGLAAPKSRDLEKSDEGDDEAEIPAESVALVTAAVEALNRSYDESSRAFRIEEVAGGLRLMTRPEFASAVAAFHRARRQTKLTKAGLETLAIIAYRQPITRADLEAIRGVACGEVLRSLLDRRLITIKGRAEELGRPLLYGTTKQFLDVFGLSGLKDLPTVAELKIGLEPKA
jgi:segregation and condensation protein B